MDDLSTLVVFTFGVFVGVALDILVIEWRAYRENKRSSEQRPYENGVFMSAWIDQHREE